MDISASAVYVLVLNMDIVRDPVACELNVLSGV